MAEAPVLFADLVAILGNAVLDTDEVLLNRPTPDPAFTGKIVISELVSAIGALSFPVLDNVAVVKGHTDPTKRGFLVVETNVPTGTDVNLVFPAASGTVATLENAQTFIGSKTFGTITAEVVVINNILSGNIGNFTTFVATSGSFAAASATNLQINGASLGSGASGVVSGTPGTEPGSSPTDVSQLFVKLVGGVAYWHERGEDGVATQLAGLNRVGAYTKQQYATQATLTDAASIAWNLDDAQSAKVTLGGNRTLANPSNMKAGATYILEVIQDATGSRTLAYGTAYKWPGGSAPVLSTAAGAVDIITFQSNGTQMRGVIQKAFS